MLTSFKDCLIRNVVLRGFVRGTKVEWKAYRDSDPDGMSLTATGQEISDEEDVGRYRDAASQVRLPEGVHRIGIAVLQEQEFHARGLRLDPDPHSFHSFGHLHALGPKPSEIAKPMMKVLSNLATQTGRSKEPEFV